MRSFSLIIKQFSRSVLLIAGFAFMGASAYAQGDAAKGEALFKANCTTCHKIESRLIGPALGPTITDETDDKFLTHWIENNQALIAAKDPKALKIYNEYNQSGMTVFGSLTDGDVANILAYVRTTWKTMQAAPKAAGGGAGAAAAESGPSSLVIFALLGVIVLAFIIILVLNRVIATLERLLNKNQGVLITEAEVSATEGPAVYRLAIKKAGKKIRNWNSSRCFAVLWHWAAGHGLPCGLLMFTRVTSRCSLSNSRMTYMQEQ